MAGPTVTLSFAGDAARVEKSMANVGAASKKMAADLDAASDKATFAGKAIGQAGDAADSSESKFMGTADVLDGLGAAFGLPTEAATGMFRAFGDLSGGFAQLQGLLGAGADKIVNFGKAIVSGEIFTKAWTASQAAFNAVMALNPAILITAGIIALGAALVLAYQKSETFRNIVQGAFNVVRGAAEGVVNFFTGIPDKLGSLAAAITNAFTAPFRAAFNIIAKAWNATVGGFGIPSIGVGPFKTPGFSIPKMPEFKAGGMIPGTPGAPVMILAHAGETVSTSAQMSRGSDAPRVIQLVVDGRTLARVVADAERGNAAKGYR